MSLHFIIDGYNLIKQAPNILNKIKLQDTRVALIRFLAIYRPQGSSNNQVTVVFDGRQGNYYSRATPLIEVVFSQEQSADDKIKNMLETLQNPKNVVVVTNDKDIRLFVKQAGAQVKTVEEFLAKFSEQLPSQHTPSKCRKNNKDNEDKVILTAQEAAKITDELKKLWLS